MGRAAERWFQGALPSSWLFHKPTEDFGIDGIVVIGDDSAVTSLEFGVQVKASRKWSKDGSAIVVAGVRTDAVRYWMLRLSPTLIVVFDPDGSRGYYGWTSDVVDTASIGLPPTKTMTISISVANLLDDDAWQRIRSSVASHHSQLMAATEDRATLKAVLATVHALVGALKLLQVSPFADPQSEFHRDLAGLGDVLAHREVVLTYRKLAQRLSRYPEAAGYFARAAEAHRAQCATFFHPFEPVLAEPMRTVALWADEARMREMRPQMALAVSEAISFLTGSIQGE